MPASDGGPLAQIFSSCVNLACPNIACTGTDALLATFGTPIICGPDAGSSTTCCTSISTSCTPSSGPFCAPASDPTGLFSELLSANSLGVLDPASTLSLTASGSTTTAAVTGNFTVIGEPCDGDCSVGVGFELRPEDLTTPQLSLSGLELTGNTMTPRSVTLTGGSGPLDVSDLDITAVATASGCVVRDVVFGGCFISASGNEAIEEQPQPEPGAPPVILSVDFPNHTFALQGDFYFPGDPGDHVPPFDLVANITGKLLNEPPTADAGPSQTVECDSADGGAAVLNAGGSSDPDDNLSIYSWHQGDPLFGPALGATAVVQVQAPFGGSSPTTTSYGLTVMDSFGQMSTATTSVTVDDTQPPTIASLEVDPSCLWPPNHDFVLISLGQQITVSVQDTCDPSPAVYIKDVADSQPAAGGGSGNTSPDFLFGPKAACLRSERDGTQNTPRIYTVTIAAVDAAGNETDRSVQVTVPHDEGQGHCPALSASAFVADDDPRCAAGADAGSLAAPSRHANDLAAEPPRDGTQRPAPAGGCATVTGTFDAAWIVLLAGLAARRRRVPN